MEDSLSMPELTALLVAKREKDYDDKKFFAAIQGIDLDKESGKSRGQKEWEDIKARVFSKGQTKDSDDVLSLQGANASKSGFGIGAGLEYASVKDSQNPKNPLKP
jgi:opacity protein-like surface antigen